MLFDIISTSIYSSFSDMTLKLQITLYFPDLWPIVTYDLAYFQDDFITIIKSTDTSETADLQRKSRDEYNLRQVMTKAMVKQVRHLHPMLSWLPVISVFLVVIVISCYVSSHFRVSYISGQVIASLPPIYLLQYSIFVIVNGLETAEES